MRGWLEWCLARTWATLDISISRFRHAQIGFAAGALSLGLTLGPALAAPTCADINAGQFDASLVSRQTGTPVSLSAGDVITMTYTVTSGFNGYFGNELDIGAQHIDGTGTSGTLTLTVASTGTQTFGWRAFIDGGTSTLTVSFTCVSGVAAPIANPVSATVPSDSSGNVIPLNVTGGTATSVAVSTAASHGTATASGTSITYTPTPGYAGTDTFAYTATNLGGISAPATATITVQTARPTVTSAAPNTGPIAGQTTVVVTGTQFIGVTAVKFGGTNVVSFAVNSPTEITVVTAAHVAGTVDITVTTQTGTATGAQLYSYSAMPNPALDPTVQALVDFQVRTVQVMGQQQINNVQDRLTQLHNDTVPVVSQTAAIVGPGTTGAADPAHPAAPQPPTARAKAGDAPSMPVIGPETPLLFWTAGTLQFGNDTTYAGAHYSVVTTGLTVGGDTRITADLKVGIAAGFGVDHATIGTLGSRIDANLFAGELYASYRLAPRWFLDGLVGYASGTLGTGRYDSSALTMADGNRTSSDLFGSLALTNEFTTDRWKVSPYARLDLQLIRLNAYSETGAGIYNLTYRSTSSTDLTGAIGTKIKYRIDTDFGILTPSLELGYRHSFASPYDQSIFYTAVPGTSYDLRGIAEKRDQALVGLGLDLDVSRQLAIGISLDGAVADHAASGEVKARVTWHY
ncbi:autotransporter domain-containing protein [Telmatospirillum sp.]|uniref:autotransporter domain-containing protein n=1 Tax=Telmatospirillum sp. TaxID=2079197 RepID=UPI0028519B3F|nr:autotransporter domain-containing protein [Telmatospirillum sp.]MDR3437256.1 autotransporter domain-containing protein [Telmatospirillum sp.]